MASTVFKCSYEISNLAGSKHEASQALFRPPATGMDELSLDEVVPVMVINEVRQKEKHLDQNKNLE